MTRLAVPLSLGLLTALAVIAFLFAASVEQLTFTSGRPFDETISNPTKYTLEPERPPEPLHPIDLAVTYGVLILMVVGVVYFFHKNAGGAGLPRRKGGRWPALLLIAAVVGAVSAVLMFGVNWSGDKDASDPSVAARSASADDAKKALGENPTINGLMGTGSEATGPEGVPAVALIGGLLGAVALGVGTSVVVWRLRRKPSAAEEDVADKILAPVRTAVAELRLGRDPRGAVEQCYRRMLRTLAERSKVDPACLTPREFVAALSSVGLDGAAVGELSTLFEEVHYGHRPEETLAARALQCMTAIATSYPAPEATP